MSDTATDLTPDTALDAPPAQAQGDGDPAPLQIEDDAAVDAVLEQDALAIPGGDKLVSMSETARVARAYRAQVKDLKTELESAKTSAARATELEGQITALNAKVSELTPYVSAYQAMTQAAQSATPEDTSDAEEYARLLDLYTNEGKPDIERGKKGLALMKRLAEQEAQRSVAPLHQQTAQQQAAGNLARIKATVAQRPDLGIDPNMVDVLAARLEPGALANPETAKWLLAVAAGVVSLGNQGQQTGAKAPPRTPGGQFTATPPPGDPLFIEKAGGKDTEAVSLNDKERAYIKAAGLSEKDYLESAKSAPWLRR
jgi:hypothetical protein